MTAPTDTTSPSIDVWRLRKDIDHVPYQDPQRRGGRVPLGPALLDVDHPVTTAMLQRVGEHLL